jgi:hypothetical protein
MYVRKWLKWNRQMNPLAAHAIHAMEPGRRVGRGMILGMVAKEIVVVDGVVVAPYRRLVRLACGLDDAAADDVDTDDGWGLLLVGESLPVRRRGTAVHRYVHPHRVGVGQERIWGVA